MWQISPFTFVEVSQIGKCNNGKMTNNGEENFNV